MIEIFALLSLILLSYTALEKGWQDKQGIIISLYAIAAIALITLRKGGFDYDDYVITVDILRDTFERDVELDVRLLIAKDPLMLAIADMGQYIPINEYIFVFLCFALVGIIPKAIAASRLPDYSLQFLTAYIIFLSPALEFAAIRAAAAIALVLLAGTIKGRPVTKFFTLVAGGIAHVSAFPFITFEILGRFIKTRAALFGALIICAAGSYLASGILVELERGESFAANAGTIGALIFPILTLAIFLLQTYSTGPTITPRSVTAALGIGLAIGLALPSVTISFRLLEISWCLMLFNLYADSQERRWSHPQLKQACFIGLFLMFSISNIVRNTWHMLIFGMSFQLP